MAVKTNCKKNGKDYYRLHRKINGKYEDFYGKSKSEAEEKYYERKKQAELGVIQSKDITINSFFIKWLFSVKIHEIKNTTLESYEGTYRNHIKPYSIANLPIKNITSIVVQDYYNKMFKDGKTTDNIIKTHKLLNTFFKYVEKEGYLAKNPCNNVTIPKNKNIDVNAIIEKKKLPFNYFTPDEIKLLRKAFAPTNYGDVVDFALATGTREGEVVGLQWTQLDFEKRQIAINNNTTRSADYNENGEKIGYSTKDGTPKTESSVDIIPMPDFVYNMLINKPRVSEYVFTVRERQIDKKDLEKVWRKTVKKLSEENEGFVYRVFHDLRHTFAVLLLQNGTDLYTIMKLMRHKRLSSTEIYLAVLPESKEESVNKLNYLFQN